MKKLLAEPLVHFLALGLILFVAWGLVGDRSGREVDQITVGAVQIEQLASAFQMTWRRPPTENEMAGLIEDFLKEEVYYREALALGFDRGDQIIRRRLRQKMEFLSEDVAEAVEPSREELQAFLDQNPDQFRTEPVLTFSHAYFSVDRRGDNAEADARAFLESLGDPSQVFDPRSVGDPFVLPHEYVDARSTEIAGYFGGRFLEQLLELDIGSWLGPVESGYGVHLVRVDARTEGAIPSLVDVEAGVRRELMALRRRDTEQAVFETLRGRYAVTVEWPEGMDPIAVDGVSR